MTPLNLSRHLFHLGRICRLPWSWLFTHQRYVRARHGRSSLQGSLALMLSWIIGVD